MGLTLLSHRSLWCTHNQFPVHVAAVDLRNRADELEEAVRGGLGFCKVRQERARLPDGERAEDDGQQDSVNKTTKVPDLTRSSNLQPSDIYRGWSKTRVKTFI